MALAMHGSAMQSRGNNISTQELQLRIVPTRAGDPLGLGLPRPAAPQDPDAYDCAAEEVSGARSLLSEKELHDLNAEGEAQYLTFAQVRNILNENIAKRGMEEGGIDPELMIMIDARTQFKIFVAGDRIYTREELYEFFPFHEFGNQPESCFVQQEIGVFDVPGGVEYIARDVGDESVAFLLTKDLVRLHAYPLKAQTGVGPKKIIQTKIYIGKEQWRDFSILQQFFRGMVRVASVNPSNSRNLFQAIMPATAGATATADATEVVTADATADATLEDRVKALELALAALTDRVNSANL